MAAGRLRLDKFLASATGMSRGQAKSVVRQGRVTVGGVVAKSGDIHVTEDATDIIFDDQPLRYQNLVYAMLHKPVGYLSTTKDEAYPCVLRLLPVEWHRRAIHSAGRLDVDSTGLLLLSDDGSWTHRLTAPASKVSKVYLVTTHAAIPPELVAKFAVGISLPDEEERTKPAVLTLLGECQARVTLTEGRFHQVKRMFEAFDLQVTTLHREAIGGLRLDPTLAVGDYRELTADEIDLALNKELAD
jgi:16S rRNA pseudouridine516 synthase